MLDLLRRLAPRRSPIRRLPHPQTAARALPRRRTPLAHPLAALVAASLFLAPPLAAQSVGGMLYAYRPHDGERARFDEGYREHLEWHRAAGDTLPWYGWDIVAGKRMGEFVDGTFGVAFVALDRRVDPAGDAAHAARSFTPHARATGQWAVRLRPDLGTATPLEARTHGGELVQVVKYSLPVGHQARFESVLQRVRAGAERARLLPYTVYETVAGGSDAELTVFVWRSGMAEFDDDARDPTSAIRRALPAELGTALRAESELWRLRRDLTLLPGRETAANR